MKLWHLYANCPAETEKEDPDEMYVPMKTEGDKVYYFCLEEYEDDNGIAVSKIDSKDWEDDLLITNNLYAQRKAIKRILDKKFDKMLAGMT